MAALLYFYVQKLQKRKNIPLQNNKIILNTSKYNKVLFVRNIVHCLVRRSLPYVSVLNVEFSMFILFDIELVSSAE